MRSGKFLNLQKREMMISVSVSHVPYPCDGSKLEERKAGKVCSEEITSLGCNLEASKLPLGDSRGTVAHFSILTCLSHLRRSGPAMERHR